MMHFLSGLFFPLIRYSALFVCCFNTVSLSAATLQSEHQLAETALITQQFDRAKQLFSLLEQQQSSKEFATQGLAKVALATGDIDSAKHSISALLAITHSNPDYLFLAGKLALTQAATANVFNKISYAIDAKQYFTHAISLDNYHQDALVGLIHFHQQAPVMAGGDKETAHELLKQLRTLNQRAAFIIELPHLLETHSIEVITNQFQSAIDSPSRTALGQFKFDCAMQFSYSGHYQLALKTLLSIELPAQSTSMPPPFAAMRLYQIGKMAAVSKTQLAIGLTHMLQYAQIPIQERNIDDDWVNFRLAQLRVLQGNNAHDQQLLLALSTHSDDDDLKGSIQTFLRNQDY